MAAVVAATGVADTEERFVASDVVGPVVRFVVVAVAGPVVRLVEVVGVRTAAGVRFKASRAAVRVAMRVRLSTEETAGVVVRDATPRADGAAREVGARRAMVVEAARPRTVVVVVMVAVDEAMARRDAEAVATED
jgi:hypothetical protein